MIERIPLARLLGIPKIREILNRLYEQQLLGEIRENGNLPKHIAIILDGNRRFAKKLGFPPTEGHKFGAKKLEEVLDWCRELGIRYVTVYAFSTENFQRSREEVEKLMDLFAEKFERVARDERTRQYNVRVKVIGEIEMLPPHVQDAIKKAEDATRDNDGYILNVAVGYGGRKELARAVRRICECIERGELRAEDVSEDLIEKHLYTAGLPDPDLIIRTSGEERLSGFLLWQSAYSELYFCEADWPAFSKLDFLRAIRNYQSRQRRFGC
ncbi:MAG: polyprenyl diphosphate synthase [Candidatus Hadarchaeales archaeon]